MTINKKIVFIKIIMYVLLFFWLLYLLWNMLIQPYTPSGTHEFTYKECEKSYDCKCDYDKIDNGIVGCRCKYKKWFYEAEGNCMKKITDYKPAN